MSTLRFVILKQIDNRSEVVLEYDQEQLLIRLQNRVKERLIASEKHLKHRWTKAEVEKAVGEAFNMLVNEFKSQTITIVP